MRAPKLVPESVRAPTLPRLNECCYEGCCRGGTPPSGAAWYCGACRAVRYCNQRCADAHWAAEHSTQCARMAAHANRSAVIDQHATRGLGTWAAECTEQPLPAVPCSVLQARNVHHHPMFYNLCSCGRRGEQPSFDAAAALSSTLDEPTTLPGRPLSQLPLNPRAVLTWSDYYAARGIPKESPIALVLTFPLTVMHILSELRLLRPPAPPAAPRVVVHLLGPESEARALLPLWGELSWFVPKGLELCVCMVGPAVPIALEQRIRRFDRSADGCGTVTLSFARGAYHSERARLPAETRSPDIIIALNAGLASFVQYKWAQTLLAIARCDVPAIFTEYCEHSVDVSRRAMTQLGFVPPIRCSVNPFVQPWRRDVPCAVPDYGNGFIFGKGWPLHSGDDAFADVAALPPVDMPGDAIAQEFDKLCTSPYTYPE